MEYLMDTHVALWWWADDPQLSPCAVDLLSNPRNSIYFSAISASEMLLKNRLGKLNLPIELITGLPREVFNEGWIERPVTLSDSVAAARFPVPIAILSTESSPLRRSKPKFPSFQSIRLWIHSV